MSEQQTSGLTREEREAFLACLRQNLGYRAFVIEDTMADHADRFAQAAYERGRAEGAAGMRARVEAVASSWEAVDKYARFNFGETTEGPAYAKALRRALDAEPPPTTPPDHDCDDRCDHLGEWLGGGQ